LFRIGAFEVLDRFYCIHKVKIIKKGPRRGLY